jgi:type IV pilus assembly protein PilC
LASLAAPQPESASDTPAASRTVGRFRRRGQHGPADRAPELGRDANKDETEAVSSWRRPRTIGRPVKAEVVMAFSRQIASFLEAGISVLEALEIVGEESASDVMRSRVAEMRAAIERGASFADAVNAHPDVFPAYYRAMVRSAEFTGRLDDVLNQLSVYLERDIIARKDVKSALTYPILVLVVATAAMIVMAVFVLPKFSGMYRSLGADLPLPTRMLLGTTDFMTGSWPLILLAILVAFTVSWTIIGGDHGKRRRDRFMMRLPVVGVLFHMISIERFCRVLAALAKAGVPLPDAIEMSAASTNNSIFETKLAVVRDTLIRGGGLSAPMIESGIFPTAARQMIRVGERTGSLGHQLTKAAGYYEREVSFRMKRATDLFQPAVIMFVGILVGFVAVAQVSAMYSIFSQVQT